MAQTTVVMLVQDSEAATNLWVTIMPNLWRALGRCTTGEIEMGHRRQFPDCHAFLAFFPLLGKLMDYLESLPMQLVYKFREFLLLIQYPPNRVAPLKGTLTPGKQLEKATFDSRDLRDGLRGEGLNNTFSYTPSLRSL